MSLKQVQSIHSDQEIDPNGPKAMVNMVPKVVRSAIINLQNNHPEWCDKGEQELANILKPDDLSDRIRVCFWREYERASQTTIGMNMTHVYGRLISRNHFYNLIKKPEVVAWMITPTMDIMATGLASYHYGKNHMAKIVKEGPFDENGKLDLTKAPTFLRAFKILEDRVLGAVTQRIEQKTETTHITHQVAPTSEELQKLRDMGVIDVTDEEAE